MLRRFKKYKILKNRKLSRSCCRNFQMEKSSYLTTIPADSGVRSTNRRADIQSRSEQQSQRHKTKRRHNASETQQHQHEYHYDDYESLPFPGRRNATTTTLEGQVEVFSAKVPEVKLNEDKRNQVVVSNSSYYATIPAPSPKVNNTTAGKHSLKREFHVNVKSLQNDLKKPQTPKSDRLFREKQLTRASYQHTSGHQSSGSEPRPPVALPARTNVHEEERSIVASPTTTSREPDAAVDKRGKSELRQLYKCDHESKEHDVNSFDPAGTIAHLSQIPVSVSRLHAPLDFQKYIDLRDNYSASVSDTSDQSNQVQTRTNSVKTYESAPQRSTQEVNKQKRRSDSVERERRRTGYMFPEKSSLIQRMEENDKKYNDRMNEHNSSLTQDVPKNSWESWGRLPDSLERFRKLYPRKKVDTTNDEGSDESQSDVDSDSDLSASPDEEQGIHESEERVAVNKEEKLSSSQAKPNDSIPHDSLRRRITPYKDDLKQFQKQILAHSRKITDEETFASDEHKTNGGKLMSSKNKNISPSSAQKRISTPWPNSEELKNLKLAMQDPLTQQRKNSIDVGTEHQRRRSSSVDKEANGNKADSNTQTSPSLLITATRHIDAHNTNRRASPTSEDLRYNDSYQLAIIGGSRPAMLNGINQDRKNMKDVSTPISTQRHVRVSSDEHNKNKRDSQSSREDNIAFNTSQKRNTHNLGEINNLNTEMEVPLSQNGKHSNDRDIKSQRRISGSIDKNQGGTNNISNNQRAMTPQIIVRGPSEESEANEKETQSLKQDNITINSTQRRYIPERNNLDHASVQDPLTQPPENNNDIKTQNQRKRPNSKEENKNKHRDDSKAQTSSTPLNINATRYNDAQETNTGEPQISREEKILARLVQNRKHSTDVERKHHRRRSSSIDGTQNRNDTSPNIQTSAALQPDVTRQSADEQKRERREDQTSKVENLSQSSSPKTETAVPTPQKQIEKVNTLVSNLTAVDEVSKIVPSLPTRSPISSQNEGNITEQYRHNSKPPANHLANHKNNFSRITEKPETSTPASLPSSSSYTSHIHVSYKTPELTNKERSVSPETVPGANDGTQTPSVYALQGGTRRHLARKEVHEDETLSGESSNDSPEWENEDSNVSQESEYSESVSNESNPVSADSMDDSGRSVNVMPMTQFRGRRRMSDARTQFQGRGRMNDAMPNNNGGPEIEDVHAILNQFTGVHIERNAKTPVPKDPETFPDIPKTASRRYLADHLSHHGSKQYLANRSINRIERDRYGNILYPQANRRSQMYNATVENDEKIPLEMLPHESAISMQLKTEILDGPQQSQQFVIESQQRENVGEEQKSNNGKSEMAAKRLLQFERLDSGGNKGHHILIIRNIIEPEITNKIINRPLQVNNSLESEGKDTPWYHQSKRTSHIYPTHKAKFMGLPQKKLPRESEKSVQVKIVELDLSEMELPPPPQPQNFEKNCACKHLCDSSALQ